MKKLLTIMLAVMLGITSTFAGITMGKKNNVKAEEKASTMKMPIVVYDHLDDHFLFEYDLGQLMGLSLYENYNGAGVPDNAGKGLVETELSENGTPVYKKETVERAAAIMKDYIEKDYNVDNDLHNKIRALVSTPGNEKLITGDSMHDINLKELGWSVPKSAYYTDKPTDTWTDSDGNTLYELNGDVLTAPNGGTNNPAILDLGTLPAGKYKLTRWSSQNMNITVSIGADDEAWNLGDYTFELTKPTNVKVTSTPTSNDLASVTAIKLFDTDTDKVLLDNAMLHKKHEATDEGWVFPENSSWSTSIYGGVTCDDDETSPAYIEMDVEPGKDYIIRYATNDSNLMVAKVTLPNGDKLADVSGDYNSNNKFTVPSGVSKVRVYVEPTGEGVKVGQEGKKVRRFDNIYLKKLADVRLGDYEESKQAYSVNHTKNKLEDITTCMDYIYYMTNNFWSDTGNDITQRTSLYKTLTLDLQNDGKMYEFDNSHTINYDIDNKNISQDSSTNNVNMGFYPIDKKILGEKSDLTGNFGTGDKEYVCPYEAGEPEHNYHFAMKAHCEFYYDKDANLEFNFRGDDDVYLFINNKLALDIGGAHQSLEGSVKLNDIADKLGLEDGELYSFDFFYMERHTTVSNIRIQTNMTLLQADAKPSVVFKDKNGNELADGSKVPAGDEVNLEYNLKAGVKGMSNITFVDDEQGVKIGKDGFDLGDWDVDGDLKVQVKDKNGNVIKTVSISKDDINNPDKVNAFKTEVGNLVLDKDQTATVSGLKKKMPMDSVLKSELDVKVTAPQISYDNSGNLIYTPEDVSVTPVSSKLIPTNQPKAALDVKLVDNVGNELTGTVTEGTKVGVEYTLTANSDKMDDLGIEDIGIGFSMSKNGVVIPKGYNIDNGLTVELNKNGNKTVITIDQNDIDNKTAKYNELLSNLGSVWELNNSDYIKVTGLNTNITSSGITANAVGTISGKVPSYNETTDAVTVSNTVLHPTDKATLSTKPNAKVNFVVDPNKGSVGDNDKVEYTVDIGDKTNAQPTVTPKEGYTFSGWEKTTDSNSNPTNATSPKDDEITENTTYTAKFTPIKYPYTVRYIDENGDDIVPPVKCDPEDYNSEVTKKALYFDAFDLDDDPSKKITIKTSNNEIVFKYKTKQVDVKFKADNGGELTGNTNDRTLDYGDKVSDIPTPQPKKGYDFAGWEMTNETTDNPVVSDDPSAESIKSNTVFTAKFTPKKYDYIVRYVEVDESGKETEIHVPYTGKDKDYDSSITENALDIDGYELVGDDTKSIVMSDDKNEIVFTYKKKNYKVTFKEEENGTVTNGKTNQTVKYNDTSNEPTVKPKDGYKFIGWATTDENGKEVIVTDINSIKITKDTVFTAKYEKVTQDNTDADSKDTGNDNKKTNKKTKKTTKKTDKKSTNKSSKKSKSNKKTSDNLNNTITDNDGGNISTVSPQTGYYKLLMSLGVVILISIIGIMISLENIKKNK